MPNMLTISFITGDVMHVKERIGTWIVPLNNQICRVDDTITIGSKFYKCVRCHWWSRIEITIVVELQGF